MRSCGGGGLALVNDSDDLLHPSWSLHTRAQPGLRPFGIPSASACAVGAKGPVQEEQDPAGSIYFSLSFSFDLFDWEIMTALVVPWTKPLSRKPSGGSQRMPRCGGQSGARRYCQESCEK